MSRSLGLQGNIGTATHTVFVRWTPERVNVWLTGFFGREGMSRGDLVAHAARDAFFAEHFAVIYCTVCGETCERGDKDRVAWASTRKCDACAAAKRHADAHTKFCRQCRATIVRPVAAEHGRTEASIRKAWSSMSTCTDCKETNVLVEREADRFAREVRQRKKAEYLASLPEPVRRRIDPATRRR